MKIIMKNTASYEEEVSLCTDKKVNLIYGLNGTGKSTIANYLQSLDHDDFSDCSIEGFDKNSQKILVYNRKFIKDNFYESNTQRGIFTLSKDNKQALENINTANNEKKELETLKEYLNGTLKECTNNIDENYNIATGKTFKIKEEYTGGDRIFDTFDFLKGVKSSKKDLFDKLKNIKLETPNKSIDDIKEELSGLQDDATERNKLSKIDIDFSSMEQNTIFQEVIIGSETSAVSELIQRLNNSDWVRQGIKNYTILDKETCPFCQQETLTEKLKQDIEDYFDENYKEKIDTLESLQKENEKNLENMAKVEDYKKDFFSKESCLNIEELFTKLEYILRTNRDSIKEKIGTPSKTIELQSSEKVLKEINTWIEERNKEIIEYNNKLADKQNIIETLKTEFWKIQRKEYNETIKNYENQKQKLYTEKQKIEKDIQHIDINIGRKNTLIKEEQTKVSDMDTTIDSINKHLIDFGINEFFIEKHGEYEYKIQRKKQNDEDIFSSLSEGEKTVISFLYFIELSKGRENPEDTKGKIVVIDDPISSLSHIYIFNISELIKSTFMREQDNNNMLQCFILTHSLYFFHELANKSKNNIKYFRIIKKENSEIKNMKRTDIRNDYESYWDIIKNSNESLMANAMRNIIEYFFGFVRKKNGIKKIFEIKEFKDNKYQSFKRYMNRYSHSDMLNINDYKDIDINMFKEAFELMFKEAGYEKHYSKYMGICNDDD